MTDASSECTVDDCHDKNKGLGYCKKHYYNFKRYNNPLHTTTQRTICSLDWCDRQHVAKGYCARHYNQLKTRGSIIDKKPEICKVTGCGIEHYSKGYCNNHYRKFNKYGESLTMPVKSDEVVDVRIECTLAGCTKFLYAKGLCIRHYSKKYLNGLPVAPSVEVSNKKKRKVTTSICAIEGCDTHVFMKKPYCVKHFTNIKLTGKV